MNCTRKYPAKAIPASTLPGDPGSEPVTVAQPCPHCGTIDHPTIGPGNGPHAFRASCRHCNSFISWVSQYTPAERGTRRLQARQGAMAQRLPSQAQLTYLQALGDDGPVPGNMWEASQRIESLRKARAEVAE